MMEDALSETPSVQLTSISIHVPELTVEPPTQEQTVAMEIARVTPPKRYTSWSYIVYCTLRHVT